MRLTMKIVMTLITVLLLSSSTSITDEKKEKKEKETINGFALVENQEFEFVAQSMTSQKGATKTLSSHYSVTLKENKSKGYLPYVGRAHSGAYGGDGAIEFDGEITDYKVETKERKKEKNNQQLVSYQVKGEKDTYTLRFSISKTGSASLSVSSNNRQSISFFGSIEEIKVEE